MRASGRIPIIGRMSHIDAASTVRMLTAEGCRARRRRLWDALPAGPDWIVIADPSQLMYFANYFQSPFVFRSTNA